MHIIMTKHLFVRLVLLVILAFWGWRFAVSRIQVGPAATKMIGFGFEGGIDINGTVVHHLPPPVVRTTVVFLLRGEQLPADLAFWQGVATLLPRDGSVRLVAYCDGDRCTQSTKAASLPIRFPIIAYGEVVNSESLIQADSLGQCFLIREEWPQPKRVTWRAKGEIQQTIVQEAIR